MTRRLALSIALAIVLSLVSGARSVRADTSSAVAAGVAAGIATRNVGNERPSLMQGAELPDWREPSLGTAGRLAAGCGVAAEVRLTGSGTANFFDITLTNQNDFPVSVADRQVIAHFGAGRSRYLALEHEPLGEVAPDYWQQLIFRFPEKADFERQDALRVDVPVLATGKVACVLVLELVRPKGVPLRERTYTDFTQIQVDFGFNVHFASSGALRNVARNANPGFQLGFIGFPGVHHGISFDFGFDAFGRRGLPEVVPGQEANGIGGMYAMAGYVFRLLPTRRLSLSYSPSVGVYNLNVSQGSGKSSHELASETGLALRQRLRLSFFLGMVDGSRFELGPALDHSYLALGRLGEAEVSGNLFAGSLLFTFSN